MNNLRYGDNYNPEQWIERKGLTQRGVLLNATPP